MGESKGTELEELLRKLAAAPASEVPSRVRPGAVLADRLEVERPLGAGGMGRVFAAHDRVRQSRVAVKVLGRLNPRSIAQLKREFRAVAELVHPNVVRCHELFSDGSEWFFTMDLVDGVTLPALLAASGGERPWDALRDVLAQLAFALKAIHDAGLLHGDLKPSNFLITRADRRVVLLDFGLARPIGLATLRDAPAGTPGYMAPEQLRGDTLTEAVDWYAFGVVLHRALTGAAPGDGSGPRTLLPGAPADLVRLSEDLLQDLPADRPAGSEVLRRVAARLESPAAPGARAPRSILVDRDRERGALEEAYQATLSGKPAIVVLLGPSGIGKTSLATSFLGTLRERGCAVLGCSCRERESMPYKALDGVVDDLVDVLGSLPAGQAASLLPRHFADLTILFPALSELAELAPRTEVEEPSEQALVRLRAIAAFSELLANLRRRAPLAVWIDDLQWSDAESARLLGPVLGGADPVPLLFLGGCRTTAAAGPGAPHEWKGLVATPPRGPMLEALLGAGDLALTPRSEILLAPLESEAAERLALELLPRDQPGCRAAASDIAQEAEGHPLFITELAHAAGAAEGRSFRPGPATLQDLVVRRVAALPHEARRLLETAAVAGAPLPRAALREAQQIDFAEAEASLDLLKAQRLIRTHGPRDDDAVDVQHDRIREILVHGLSETHRRERHLALARILAARGGAQPEFVAAHCEAAGDLAGASRHWLLAAEQAARALAFDNAAELYQKAIEHAHLEPAGIHGLRVKRAEALAHAGRCREAADAFLATAEGCTQDEAVELRRRAAEQLLLSGHLEQGLMVMEQVLRAIGMRPTRSGVPGLLSFVAGRLRMRTRGLRHVPRNERELSREEIVRLDASWTIACSLGLVDFIRGADFQNEHVLLALRAGEPRRLLRALTIEAAYSAAPGLGSERRTRRLLAVAEALAQTSGDEGAHALLLMARGVAAYLQGRLEEALVDLQGAMDLLARTGAATVLVALTAQRFLIASLFYLGRLRRLGELVPRLLAGAEATGNRHAAMYCRAGYGSAVWLARDEVREVREQLRRTREEWGSGAYRLPHFNVLVGETYLDLYCGDAERAVARLDEQWRGMRQAHLLRIAVVRAQFLQLRSASAAAAADQADARGLRARAADLRRRTRLDLKRLRGERVVRAVPWAALAGAALAWSEGNESATREELERAVHGFDRLGMNLYAAAARIRLGERTRCPGGASVAEAGRRAFVQEGVSDPARMAGMLAPGFGWTPA